MSTNLILRDIFGKDLFNDEDFTPSIFKKQTFNYYSSFKEEDNEYVQEVLTAGIDKNDIDISLDNNSIEITSEKPLFNTKQKLYKQLRVPTNADTDNISAEIKNGVLTLKIPKQKTNSQKKIEIT